MIRQVRFSDKVKSFEKGFCDKWDVVPYFNPNESSLFVGVYDMDDVNAINNHRAFKVVRNTGRLRDCFFKINPRGVVVHIASQQQGIPENGIYKTKRAAFPIKDFSLFTPVPLGDKIYCYVGNERMKEEYGYSIIDAFRKKSPFEIIIGFHQHDIKYVMDNYYSRSFVNIKPTIYGGNTSAIEMAYMGRMTISNRDAPFCIKYSDIDEMLSVVMAESKKIGTIQPSVVGDFFDTGDEWKDENFWIS